MSVIGGVLESITGLDPALGEEAQRRLDSLTKPRGSLGRLEEFARRVVSITGDVRPEITSKKVFTFAADHGVTDEGVSAFPREVTRQMVLNFLAGGAGINVLASHAGAEVVVVDIGVDGDFDPVEGLVSKKVVRGTRNMRKGPAMTREEAERCISVGVELAWECGGKGSLFGTGEMGIGNTTAASAVTAAITGVPAREVTGRGTGIGDAAFERKVEVIEGSLRVNGLDSATGADPLDVLARVGGAEVAGIAGLILGAASRRVPVVVDGFISTAGALVAVEMKREAGEYIFAAHKSVERGHAVMLERMGLTPFVDLGLRLGEGTGAAIGISLVESALKVYNEMATFGDAGVSEEGS